MAKIWRKIIVSGSNAELNEISASSIHLFNGDGTGVDFTSDTFGAGTSINLGEYSTSPDLFPGFFDIFQNTTSITTALEEISNTISDIAPAKPGVLTGKNLGSTVNIFPEVFAAKLAGGLNPDHWNNLTPHENSSLFFRDHPSMDTIILKHADETSRFRAGKYIASTFPSNLEGGVTASRSFQNEEFEIIDKIALSSGQNAQGSNGIIKITSLGQYNTLWVKANARITQNVPTNATGSYRYKISADNGAGESNAKQLYYVGGSTPFPYISNTNVSSVTIGGGDSDTGNIMYLSGKEYFTEGTTFTVTVTADNMFNPVYATGTQGQFSFNSPITSDSDTQNHSEPNHDDQYNKTFTITVGSGQSNESPTHGTGTISLYKPKRTTKTITIKLEDNRNFGINSKGTVSTDGEPLGTFNIESFFDEDKRKANVGGTVSWNSQDDISGGGSLAVVNGKLYHPKRIHSTISNIFHQTYFRIFTPPTTVNSGQIKWSVGGDSFKNLSTATEDNAEPTGEIEMTLHVQNDANVYDLGREVDDDSGNFIGIAQSFVNESQGHHNGINFALPVQPNSVNKVVLKIKYNTNDLNNYITEVKLKF